MPLSSVKTILIVDEDLGFVFWLGRLLNDAGYQVWPARNGEDATALLKELHSRVDLVIMNPNSSGAAAFVQEQRQVANFKTIVIHAQDERAAESVSADLVLMKTPADELSAFEWVGIVERLLGKWEQRAAFQPM